MQRPQLNGTRLDRNVGGDAHIAPPRLGLPHTPMNGEMSIYPVPFNVQGGYVGVRVDVGIDPYIETIRAYHSSHRVVA